MRVAIAFATQRHRGLAGGRPIGTMGRPHPGRPDRLQTLGENLTLYVVALVPWMPLAAAIGLPSWLALRRNLRRPSPNP